MEGWRFDPPRNWPVRPDQADQADQPHVERGWRPPPEWGPLPPGHRLWVPEHPPPRRRLPSVAAFGAVAGLALVAALTPTSGDGATRADAAWSPASAAPVSASVAGVSGAPGAAEDAPRGSAGTTATGTPQGTTKGTPQDTATGSAGGTAKGATQGTATGSAGGTAKGTTQGATQGTAGGTATGSAGGAAEDSSPGSGGSTVAGGAGSTAGSTNAGSGSGAGGAQGGEAGSASSPTVKVYASCAALREVYPHGVGRRFAVDHTSGTPVTGFRRDAKVYAANRARDGDGDGIACEG